MSTTPKTITVLEARQLLNALLCRTGTKKQFRKGIRNYTMALLMLDSGLRVGEVVQLRIKFLWLYDQVPTCLYLPSWITKNKQERSIPLSGRLRDSIEELYKSFWCDFPDNPENYAFYQGDATRPMTTRQVERIIRAAAMKSIGRPIHPHILRHTFATKLMKLIDMRTVQQMLGHSQMSSTQIYTHPNLDDAKKAIDEIQTDNVPAGPRQ